MSARPLRLSLVASVALAAIGIASRAKQDLIPMRRFKFK